MKRIGILVLAAVLALTLCACRNKDMEQPNTTPNGTTPNGTTPRVTMPTIEPTMDTNIPDPDVEPTDGTGTPSEGQDATDDPLTRSRRFR